MLFLFAVPTILATLAETAAVVAVGTIVARGVNRACDSMKDDEDDSDE